MVWKCLCVLSFQHKNDEGYDDVYDGDVGLSLSSFTVM